jgi:hypothetical protein
MTISRIESQSGKGFSASRPTTFQEVSIKAGTIVHGHTRRMTGAMAESVSQRDFYGQSWMNYMASSAINDVTGQADEDRKHNDNLSLQEHMRHPTVFHAEMMGDTMYSIRL